MSSYNSLNAGTGTHSPYGSGDPYYNESTGYITPQPPVKKSGVSNWIKIGVPVLIVVVVGAVLGGVLGSRKTNDASSSSAAQANASSAVSIKNEIGRYATATNSLYLVPLYPSTVSALASTCFLPVDSQAFTDERGGIHNADFHFIQQPSTCMAARFFPTVES
jgi:hypothetical protein